VCEARGGGGASILAFDRSRFGAHIDRILSFFVFVFCFCAPQYSFINIRGNHALVNDAFN
jgi:hypothetical protein